MPTNDKQHSKLPATRQHEPPSRPNRGIAYYIVGFLAGAAYIGLRYSSLDLNPFSTSVLEGYTDLTEFGGQCPNVVPVVPNNGFDLDYFKTPEFRNLSLAKWQGSLRIATESSESYGNPGEDSRWDIFTEQEEYFEKAFPLVHKHLKREIVNQHGLVYTWKGKSDQLKPALLCSHLDVVPVSSETAQKWKYPPYEAHFDGHFVWARGSLDAKHPTLSIFEAAEQLLSRGFVPNRDLVFAFGYDEESNGIHGAKHIAEALLEKYGPNSFEVLVDEGGSGVTRTQGTNVALTSVSEKGHQQSEISFYSQGGHSSMVDLHTGIGIAADLVTVIENDPHPSTLNEPSLATFECVASHSKSIGWLQKKIILNARTSRIARALLVKSLKSHEFFANLLKTTQAVNIFQSGSKINALPEVTKFYIDHRVSIDSNIDEVQAKVEKNILEIAEKYDVGFKGFNGTWLRKGSSETIYFEVGPAGAHMGPAPISPSYGSTWNTFAGTIKHVYEDFGGELLDLATGEKSEPKEIQVIGGLHTVNTDTKYYWDLTHNIYRFIPLRIEDMPNLHAIDEHISLNGHVEGVVWYFEYMQNL